MAIYKQSGSDNWWISIYRGGGLPRKYIPTGTADKQQAEAMEAAVKSALRGNLSRDRFIAAVDSLMGWDLVEGVPVGALWDTYTRTRPRAGAHTLQIRRGLCKVFVEWMADQYPATLEIHGITAQQAQSFSDWLLSDRGGKGKTHNNRIGNLKTVFKAIIVRANMQTNPFEFVDKADQADSVSGRAFSEVEQRLIFERCAVAGNDWLAICKLAKFSGLRLVDIAGLRWGQLHGRILDITPSKTKKHGIRVRVPLHAEVFKEICLLEQSGPFVFSVLAERYGKGQNASRFMEEVLSFCEIDGANARISFHCWRHTFRTMMAAADVPTDIAMKLGGWTNESTAEIYNHFDNFEELEKAINALN